MIGDDVALEAWDGVFLREGIPGIQRKQLIFRKNEINFRRGDVLLNQAKEVRIFEEDFLFRRSEKHDSPKAYILPEKEKVIFRKGEAVSVPITEPVVFRKGEAVVFRDGEKVIFRRGEEVSLNKGFCEEALGTIHKFFDEVLTAVTNWDTAQ